MVTQRENSIHCKKNHSLVFACGVTGSFSGFCDASRFLCSSFWLTLDKTICLDWKSPHIQRSIDAAGADSRRTDIADVIVSQLHRMQKHSILPFWALSSCPTFSLTFVLRLRFLKRTPYEERSVLHKSKQRSQIHSPRWGCRHQRAHMGRQYLTIQSSGAAFRQIDYDLLPVREEVQKRMQRQVTSSPAFSELGRIRNRTERKIHEDYR